MSHRWQVATLAASAERVNQNATEIEEQLFAAVQAALVQLQRITQGAHPEQLRLNGGQASCSSCCRARWRCAGSFRTWTWPRHS